GLPLLEKRLIGLPGAISMAADAIAVGVMATAAHEAYERIQAMREGRLYDQIPGQTQEMDEMERLKRRNWARNHPLVPYPDTPTQNAGQSPNIRTGKGQPIQVHTAINLDRRQIGMSVTEFQATEAIRSARSSIGTFDPTMAAPTVGFGK
ncbi:MAG: hypothetical protein E7E83_08790, partial [Enterobacter ludwigii]|nr:hypothetical protein [Enterobacter ludwigii]